MLQTYDFRRILFLIIGYDLRFVILQNTSVRKFELFPNFYIDCDQKSIDAVREAVSRNFFMDDIEVIYFKGNEQTTSVQHVLTERQKAETPLVLFVLSNMSYPSIREVSSGAKLNDRIIVYKFKINRNQTRISYNLQCVQRCVFFFAMIFAESFEYIKVKFTDKYGKDLGPQLPTMYALWVVGASSNIGRMFKSMVAVSYIRIFPADEYEDITLDVFETFTVNVRITKNVIVSENNFIFYPRFRTAPGIVAKRERFQFDRMGKYRTTVTINPGASVIDQLDLVVLDSSGQIVTYYPLLMTVKELEPYDPQSADVGSEAPPSLSGDYGYEITSLGFPEIFDHDEATSRLRPAGNFFLPLFLSAIFISVCFESNLPA